MFTIADLSQVWVMVDIYEHQIDWLAPGLSAPR
jgi:Cu(I)/Ag(I) efflux system membrane fusion protein